MLQDEIVLNIDPELGVYIDEYVESEDLLVIDLFPEISTEVNLQVDGEAYILVDFETFALDPDSITPQYAKIYRFLTFVKSILAHKTTFGSSSLVIVDNIQTIGTLDSNPANRNLVARPITFTKAVSAKKTTFAQLSFVINDNIQTAAINTVGNLDFYGTGLYGDGLYGVVSGYGEGLYGEGLYSGVYPGGILSLGIGFGGTVSGNKLTRQTAVAEISLAPHGSPSARTNHSLKIRARTTSGSTGVIKAALYEGAVNRSGDLTSTPLTNSLADYTLTIPDAAAASISDYSNLSVRIWGYDPNGAALVFEISKIYLELPVGTGTTHYGVVSRTITFTKAVAGIHDGATYTGVVNRATTFTKAVAGVISSKRTATAEISLASHGTPSVRTNHSIKVRARTTSGSTGVLKAELYEGSTVRSGATPLATSALTNSLADYTLAIPDAAAASITSYTDLSIKFWGFDSAGNALVFEVSKIYLELPTP